MRSFVPDHPSLPPGNHPDLPGAGLNDLAASHSPGVTRIRSHSIPFSPPSVAFVAEVSVSPCLSPATSVRAMSSVRKEGRPRSRAVVRCASSLSASVSAISGVCFASVASTVFEICHSMRLPERLRLSRLLAPLPPTPHQFAFAHAYIRAYQTCRQLPSHR